MLREIKQLKQEPGPGRRRWFESDGLDLVLWYDAEARMTGFQLLYPDGADEHALTWRAGSGFAYDRVDEGEASPFKNLTPILVPDGRVPWTRLAQLFAERSAELPGACRELIRARLEAGAAAARD